MPGLELNEGIGLWEFNDGIGGLALQVGLEGT